MLQDCRLKLSFGHKTPDRTLVNGRRGRLLVTSHGSEKKKLTSDAYLFQSPDGKRNWFEPTRKSVLYKTPFINEQSAPKRPMSYAALRSTRRSAAVSDRSFSIRATSSGPPIESTEWRVAWPRLTPVDGEGGGGGCLTCRGSGVRGDVSGSWHCRGFPAAIRCRRVDCGYSEQNRRNGSEVSTDGSKWITLERSGRIAADRGVSQMCSYRAQLDLAVTARVWSEMPLPLVIGYTPFMTFLL